MARQTQRPSSPANRTATEFDRFSPQRVLTDALGARVSCAGALQAPDPLLFLHEERRMVDKDGIDVEGIRFMSAALRPFVGTKRAVPVRYDAAAGNRKQLSRVFVVIEGTRARQRDVIECLPRPLVRDTTDRAAFEAESRQYRASLRQQNECAIERTARRRGGHAAGERQRDLHVTRQRQGRAGQEASGYGAPRPEVEMGVRAHSRAKLEKKAKKLKPATSKAKAAKTSSSTTKSARTSAARAAASASGGDGAYDVWNRLGRVADGHSGATRKRSR